jgi:hypothetical protein
VAGAAALILTTAPNRAPVSFTAQSLASAMPINTLNLNLANWRLLLQAWAADGRLSAAAQEALLLDGEPALLPALIEQWAEGNFSGLPPIMLLQASSMPGAAGAYVDSTGTIYINEDCLQSANRKKGKQKRRGWKDRCLFHRTKTLGGKLHHNVGTEYRVISCAASRRA